MGIQVVAPDGCYVREHWHSRNDEILFCFEGRGTIVVDGEPHAFVPGTTAYLGRWVKHKIVNDADQPLKIHLDVPAAGARPSSSPRSDGRAPPASPRPEPFERPAETLAVERAPGSDRRSDADAPMPFAPVSGGELAYERTAAVRRSC